MICIPGALNIEWPIHQVSLLQASPNCGHFRPAYITGCSGFLCICLRDGLGPLANPIISLPIIRFNTPTVRNRLWFYRRNRSFVFENVLHTARCSQLSVLHKNQYINLHIVTETTHYIDYSLLCISTVYCDFHCVNPETDIFFATLRI